MQCSQFCQFEISLIVVSLLPITGVLGPGVEASGLL